MVYIAFVSLVRYLLRYVEPCAHWAAVDIKVKEQSIENLMKGRKIFEPPRYMTVNQVWGTAGLYHAFCVLERRLLLTSMLIPSAVCKPATRGGSQAPRWCLWA
jgi:hypothetical protein